ncbi:uncharacterized protein P174DRAFT_82443 [Aspergillus novofumigatus IBT 16806]|uniref:Uncharacterized protein n=1 Tax=Aspergillus novofumigatus (strain IBT 16806) TaxID=1392255 RepID=A0A2I1CG15_ASPN1|nr:uncharacterized protein P174DRAFT_82443 [Aspergillus novofumigatus IBT 16806]PKX96577.1 hypothetical protein P174DRAFT_82443 [Aspergillus novofumigatus IBT 16806]
MILRNDTEEQGVRGLHDNAFVRETSMIIAFCLIFPSSFFISFLLFDFAFSCGGGRNGWLLWRFSSFELTAISPCFARLHFVLPWLCYLDVPSKYHRSHLRCMDPLKSEYKFMNRVRYPARVRFLKFLLLV